MKHGSIKCAEDLSDPISIGKLTALAVLLRLAHRAAIRIDPFHRIENSLPFGICARSRKSTDRMAKGSSRTI
jgi:hypothetical protein